MDGGNVNGGISYFGGAHPSVNFMHVATKAAPSIVYIVCELINNGAFVTNFVIIVVLLGVDFWTVKNICGRLLVGLRWWNENDEEGNTTWRFETLNPNTDDRTVDAKDKFVFWTSLYVASLTWLVFTFIAIIKLSLDYLLICVIALTLLGSNIVGYVKCSKEASTQLSNFGNQATKTIVSTGLGNMFHLG